MRKILATIIPLIILVSCSSSDSSSLDDKSEAMPADTTTSTTVNEISETTTTEDLEIPGAAWDVYDEDPDKTEAILEYLLSKGYPEEIVKDESIGGSELAEVASAFCIFSQDYGSIDEFLSSLDPVADTPGEELEDDGYWEDVNEQEFFNDFIKVALVEYCPSVAEALTVEL